jgi:pimeloyl-ACP methyl ester carboxylesterase
VWRLGELARCRTVRVYEHRARNSGRQIDLHVIVLPATDRQVAPDPIVWLTGGPGLAAADDPAGIARLFSRLRAHHDIVLVDQRGTGKSAPLQCALYDDGRLQTYMDPMFPVAGVRACRARLAAVADLTQYTTENAMDDMADVLTALGYSRADIIGGSYGTQAALVFLHRHPDRVRRAVLSGVLPPNVPLFIATPRAISRELSILDSAHVVDSAMRHLPITVTLRHETITITPRNFAERMFFMLYVPGRAGRAIGLLHEALAGDWRPFVEAALQQSHWQKEGRFMGMTLSVMCAGDAALLTRADTTAPVVPELLAACAEWPHETIAPEDTMRVTSTAPVLLISGGMDPATPPELADSVALGLPNSERFVDSAAGHAPFGETEVALLTAFIDR